MFSGINIHLRSYNSGLLVHFFKFRFNMIWFWFLDELKTFREDGIFNYSTMLIREEMGLLVLGAREAIYALDLNDIRNKKTAVRALRRQRKCADVIFVMCWEVFLPSCDLINNQRNKKSSHNPIFLAKTKWLCLLQNIPLWLSISVCLENALHILFSSHNMCFPLQESNLGYQNLLSKELLCQHCKFVLYFIQLKNVFFMWLYSSNNWKMILFFN